MPSRCDSASLPNANLGLTSQAIAVLRLCRSLVFARRVSLDCLRFELKSLLARYGLRFNEAVPSLCDLASLPNATWDLRPRLSLCCGSAARSCSRDRFRQMLRLCRSLGAAGATQVRAS